SRSPLCPAFLLPFHFDSARGNLDRTLLVGDNHVAREAELSGHDEVCDGDPFEAQFVDANVVKQHEAIFTPEIELATIESMVTPAWYEYHRVCLAPQDIYPLPRIPMAHLHIPASLGIHVHLDGIAGLVHGIPKGDRGRAGEFASRRWVPIPQILQ